MPFANLNPGITDVDWLLGKWSVTKNGRTYIEHWTQSMPSYFEGDNQMLKDDALIFQEFVQLIERGNQIIYSVTIPNQNDSKAINFNLTSNDPYRLVFENLEHDFPKRMVYALENDQLHITATGVERGKPRTLDRLLTKVEE